jgi:hypothetical protein
MKTRIVLMTVALACGALLMAQQVGEMTMEKEDADNLVKVPSYSPYAGRNFPTQVYWGDTHLHTSNSLDARAFGTILGPEEAYRFARGEEITATHGMQVQLSRPLDWLVVADHSDGMGAMNEIIKGDPNLLRDPTVRDWYERLNQGGETALMATMDIINAFALGNIPEILIDEKFSKTIWDRYLDAAEAYNDPGVFTSIIGYEWTSTEDGNNLHRNVLYRDGKSLARQLLPYTTMESFNPEELWKWMQAYEDKTGGQVLALAHNGNLSNGIMFPVETNPATGEALSEDYLKTRAKWEPIYEVTQIKGDGEAHPFLSPNDEFAGYELWQKGNLNLSVPKENSMLQYEYAREALKNGLVLEHDLGINPYKFGMVGSTDSHTSLATAAEENFFGKHSGNEPSPHRAEGIVGRFEDRVYWDWEMVSSGYAAVWATENTREALFDAMERKEVYATTGSRILVRFFGGWEFDEKDAQNRLPAEIGYVKGVPMGGDLYRNKEGKAPTFLVGAMKDPLSGNLDRIQIIKGWMDAKGNTHEKVYNVAWSDMEQRKPDKNGKLPLVGNTVDVPNATWTNTIGDPELIAVWEDPDFNPDLRAFYYARVIEIPTPRWTAYDQKRFGVSMPEESPMFTQERAYTSPIWYNPGN